MKIKKEDLCQVDFTYIKFNIHNLKVGAIIFSRMDSKRLPGKALVNIGDKPMLGRVIDRAKCIKGIDKIIVATTFRKIDDEIANFSKDKGVNVFRGNVEDVASRAINACNKFHIEKFARICGDRPFFDPKLISILINMHNDFDVDLVTTMFPRTYPPGLTGEVIKVIALKNAMLSNNDSENREHLTRYFYENSSKFIIKNYTPDKLLDLKNIKLVVDNINDLNKAKWIVSKLGKKNDNCNNIEKVIQLEKQWKKINIKNL
tara:strand:- start:533 stop:1312 length:780 start_codon:yes stop_codon:yes gene_type:complete